MTEVEQTGLDHMWTAVQGAGYSARRSAEGAITAVLPVQHADSKTITYEIEITGSGRRLIAAENPSASLLPRFCPERHIVGKGVFCMYWDREHRFDVYDSASARKWLGVLIEFLRAQRRAAYLKRWPSAEAWAHGEAAAQAQRQAERAGTALLGEWSQRIADRKLVVSRDALGVHRVSKSGKPLFAAWVNPDHRKSKGKRGVGAFEPMAKRQLGYTKPKRAALLLDLARALWNWKNAEELFWTLYREQPCCGTMDTCGLRKAC